MSSEMESTRRAHKPKCNVWKYYNSEVDTNGQTVMKCTFCLSEFTASTAKNATKLRQHLTRRCLKIDERMKKSIVKEVEDENRQKYNEVVIEDFDRNMDNKNNKIITKIVVKNNRKNKDGVKHEIRAEDEVPNVKTLLEENSRLDSRLKLCLKQNEALTQITKYLDQSLELMRKLDSVKESLRIGFDEEEEMEDLTEQLKSSNDSVEEWKRKYHLIEINDKINKMVTKPKPKKESSIWQYFKRLPNKTTSDGCKVIKCVFCRKIFRQIHLNAYKCRQHIVEFCNESPEDIKEKENQWVEYNPRSKVDIWQHFKVTDDNKSGAECVYCGFSYTYKNATKFRQHLVFKCVAIPFVIKDEIRSQCNQKFLTSCQRQQTSEKSKASDIFLHFEVTEEEEGKTNCKCNYCGQTYAYKNATKFRQHLIERCDGIPGDVRQEIADKSAERAKTWTQTNIDVWKYFDVTEEDGKTNCRCVYCGHTFTYKNATKSRLHLLEKCNEIPEEEKEKILEKCKDCYLNPKQKHSLKPKRERKVYVRTSDVRGGRRKCHIWQYFSEEADSMGNIRRRCMYCEHLYGVGTSRNATKLKDHLGLFCKAIPDDIKQTVIELNDNSVRTYKKRQLQPLQWLECEWPGCDMKFPKKSRLLSHQMVHTGVTRIKCDWPGCEWTGRSRYAVNVHKHSHTGEKPYVCDWPGCDFRTANTASLCVHKMRHKNLLRYKCDWPQCERTFLTSSQRTVHKMVHLGIKPYACQFCDKRYPQLNKLKTHQNKQHSNQRQYFDYQSYNKRT